MVIRLIDKEGKTVVNRLDFHRIPNPGEVFKDERNRDGAGHQEYAVISVSGFNRIVEASHPQRVLVVTDVLVEKVVPKAEEKPSDPLPSADPVIVPEPEQKIRRRKKQDGAA